ncbi:aspartate/glutamate racemase family protein [Frigidibacter sp. RF13]|uniref:aspartate/glutamate racemase family protein n=1 Tax=Frigidibacter sp. RF13 TaxID=2997340 RepID=UPI0022721EE0|nr:aspartate/glutamate racemase family protein [Frigidibacter sp. RF13]MCY1128545.1 aspartate/glutamate racemase family protein [Frigidibacter sp. RF13]
MHIGLIGGIGVAATVVYYQRLTAEVARRGGTVDLIIAHTPDIQVLIRNNLADRRAEQAAEYAPQIDRLKAAGANCVAITSLGGHFCYAETLARSSLPLVSAVTPLDDFFHQQGIRRIGLLGTRIVMRSRLYSQLQKTEAVALDDEIEDIGQAYQEMAVAGSCSPGARDLFVEAGRRMIKEQGAEAIVLAGTDLNLAFDGQTPGYPVIDALDVHVNVLADLATGRRELEEVADFP